MMTRVEGWLSTAGLQVAEVDIATVHPKQVYGRFSCTDPKAVGNARYEEMDAWSRVCHIVLYGLSADIHAVQYSHP